MLNVPKNSYYLQFGLLEWQVLLDEKKHYEISMQMGEDTLFPKIRATDPNSYCSSWHELPPDFDGTNRRHTSSFYIKSCLKK
jgi:hypothetical protein